MYSYLRNSILQSKDLKHCHVIRQLDRKQVVSPGIIRENKFYVPLYSYNKQESSQALWRSFALNKQNVSNIIVSDGDRYTVWCVEENAVITEMEIDFAYKLDLRQLVAKMRSSEGIEIKNRYYRLKVYHQCFVGCEAVTWLENFYQISTDTAIDIGVRLIAENWLHHVCNDHHFKNDFLFYRFYLDE